MKTYSIILAWGGGMKCWPISKKYYPKQFIKFAEFWRVSLFQKALKRALLLSKIENILVVANRDYKTDCIAQAREIWMNICDCQILIESISKNTLGAITFAMKNIEDGSLAVIMPTDHVIEDEEKFVEAVEKSKEAAKKSLITFGVQPTTAYTGYGYISPEITKEIPYKVNEFKEKPDKIQAQKLIDSWYLWNSGIFLFWKEVYFDELQKHTKQICDTFGRNVESLFNPYYGLNKMKKYEEGREGVKFLRKKEKYISEAFHALIDSSIDYGLLEKSDNVYMTPLDTYWTDIWSFDFMETNSSLTEKV